MTGSEWWAAAPSDLASKEYARHVLRAVDRGLLYWQWRDLQVGPLTVRCMTQPLAVGPPEDHVHLYGMTAALMDQIVELWNFGPLHEDDRRRGVPREIMPTTSLLLDAMAAHEDAMLVGPFTQQQPPAKTSAAAASLHSAQLWDAQNTAAMDQPARDYDARLRWIGEHFWPECETYVLNPRHRPGYACEYGWHVAATHPLAKPRAVDHAVVATGDLPDWVFNSSETAVIQPEQWAHSYSAFQDYSMAAWFVSAHGVLTADRVSGMRSAGQVTRPVDLRALLADPASSHLVTVHGAQDWHTLRGP